MGCDVGRNPGGGALPAHAFDKYSPAKLNGLLPIIPPCCFFLQPPRRRVARLDVRLDVRLRLCLRFCPFRMNFLYVCLRDLI